MLLSNANFKEVGLPLSGVFKGAYYDFIPNWYTVVGYYISSTMVFNAYYPFIEWGLAYGMPWAFRLMDRSFSSDTYKTKLTSMQMYVDMYSGPKYFIHFKYSSMLNVLFVTMLYGVGIPILFPIAAITYFIYYSLERLCVAYFF